MTTSPVPGLMPPANDTPVPSDSAQALSAWLDGELEAPAAAPLVQDLLRGGALRSQYRDWCVVGDALRSNEVAAHDSPLLCSRICAALQDEPALLAPRALPRALLRNAATGTAIAAAFAVLGFFALPQLRLSLTGVPEATPAAVVARSAPVLPAQPAGAPTAMELAASRRLDPYLAAHRDLAGQGVMPAAAVYLRSGTYTDR